MADGTYANAGTANIGPGTSTIIVGVTPGPVLVTKVGDFPGGDQDPLTLSFGDTFTTNLIPGTFAFRGSDGADGIIGIGGGTRIYLTDNPLQVGDTIPPVQPLQNIGICFASGTLIATSESEKPVEDLRIGDLLLTADGDTVPMKWVGRQTLHKRQCEPDRFAPVRITAGALAHGVPHTDLVLTAEHALIIDGLAINAGALVNGTTITREPVASLPDTVTYWHVETEGHQVILANGAPAETYIDYVIRRAFDNYQEYLDLYGEDQPIAEMPLPRVSAARLVPKAIKRRLGGLVPA